MFKQQTKRKYPIEFFVLLFLIVLLDGWMLAQKMLDNFEIAPDN